MSGKLAFFLNRELNERGWSQRELSRRADLSSTTISAILSEQRAPTFDSCMAIAKALGINPNELLQLAGLLPTESGREEKLDSNEMLREIYEAVVREPPVDRLEEAKHLYLADDTTMEELMQVVKSLNHQDRVALLQFAHFLASSERGEGNISPVPSAA